MPIEAVLLRLVPEPLKTCPHCQQPFESFLRGQVGRSPHPWWDPFGYFTKPRPYCAVICRACKDIVAYEGLGGPIELVRRTTRHKGEG